MLLTIAVAMTVPRLTLKLTFLSILGKVYMDDRTKVVFSRRRTRLCLLI